MHAQTEKTIFSCKDDRILTKHTWHLTYSSLRLHYNLCRTSYIKIDYHMGRVQRKKDYFGGFFCKWGGSVGRVSPFHELIFQNKIKKISWTLYHMANLTLPVPNPHIMHNQLSPKWVIFKVHFFIRTVHLDLLTFGDFVLTFMLDFCYFWGWMFLLILLRFLGIELDKPIYGQ